MRLAFYAGASTAAAAACLLKAFHQRPNFYSATVYLSQSNACLLILTNLLLVLACTFIYGLQRLLYGPLRPIEIEQLSEKAWYAVLDTLLAMPSFREDVGGWLLTMFVLLLAGKVWGWIGEGRVDILEQQPPANPRLFHTRLATSLIVSVAFDVYMLNYCIETVMADPRPGMMVIFTFEFAILAIFSTFTLSRYLMAVTEILIQKKQMQMAVEARKQQIRADRVREREAASQLETVTDGSPPPQTTRVDAPIVVDELEIDIPGWEEKRRWLFVLEVLTDFIKLIIYVIFFTVSITFNGLPMHIMRDVYMTFASFSKRLQDFVAYRKATSDMNTRYPDATTEEIREDACIVCRETMVAWEQPNIQAAPQPAGDQALPPAVQPVIPVRRDEGLRAKKLPCGHILHLRCLKAWLERQQVCPTCRRPVVTATTPTTTQGQARGQQGQGAAQGGNGQAPAQPAQPRAQRPGRARWINLGPIRLGFLNGPGDQIQNLVEQLRNNPAGQNNAANPAQQEGPNHLGLQVPYANANTQATSTPARSTVPTQVQIMQLEQRLMQEAHNLGVEQQQLAHLRAMEAEMARLRAQHIPANRPVGTDTAAQRQFLASTMGLPALPGTPQSSVPTTLRGAQQLGSGHEHLPEGMTLPEGWTVTPLHALQPTVTQVTTQQVRHVGPTDERGSPLFVPTTAAMVPTPTSRQQTPSQPTTQTPQLPPSITAPAQPNVSATNLTTSSPPPIVPRSETTTATIPPPPSHPAPASATIPIPSPLQAPQHIPAQAEQQPRPESENKTPWQDNGWSFDANSSPQQQSAQDTNEPVRNYEGKGKGRAVEVEEVPDPDS